MKLQCRNFWCGCTATFRNDTDAVVVRLARQNGWTEVKEPPLGSDTVTGVCNQCNRRERGEA